MTDRSQTRRQRLSIVYGILCIVLLLVIMQLWLLTATMNAWLGGNEEIVWPAAIASTVCLGLNLGLMRYLVALDSNT
ncbi:hypothetical protein Q31b_10370 [Novipirellula aureliae]|uniref:Uncharacterized protein n=1 Tax=Novipirellula aureliae TaxID=2527966 RepID=A0A5C6EDQ9_9BACT|nr:DUF6755 family protein [Novipirellula aureliae]TWU45861.1 hypothetical protein Q31b_10370 [Novipirellula aureliae]